MSLSNRYKLPRIPPISVRKCEDSEVPTMVEYDEVIFDYRTNRYVTLGQQKEIYRLQDELEKQNQERERKLKNIIGYYYKRN